MPLQTSKILIASIGILGIGFALLGLDMQYGSYFYFPLYGVIVLVCILIFLSLLPEYRNSFLSITIGFVVSFVIAIAGILAFAQVANLGLAGLGLAFFLGVFLVILFVFWFLSAIVLGIISLKEKRKRSVLGDFPPQATVNNPNIVRQFFIYGFILLLLFAAYESVGVFLLGWPEIMENLFPRLF